jgi:hypothetical protein
LCYIPCRHWSNVTMSVALAKIKMEIVTSPPRSIHPTSNDGHGGTSDQVHPLNNIGAKKRDDRRKDAIASTITTIKLDLNVTPRTAASSPDSRDGTLDVEDDEAEGGVCGGDVMIRQKSSTTSDDTTNKDDDVTLERRMMDEEMPMSQTDRHIHQLDREGQLNEVAGSQSMLSQELIYDIQCRGRPVNRSGDDDDDDDKNSVGCLTSLHLSQETETSMGMAKRIGLLSMTQDEEESEEDTKPPASDGDIGANTTISTNTAENPCTPKRSEGLFSVLSHASNTGAPDLGSFSAKKEIIAAENKPKMDITDTPVRESEGFGSLLDAVAKITEQEISEEGEDALLWRRSLYLLRHPDEEAVTELSPTRRKRSLAPRYASTSPTRKSPRKSAGVHSKRKIPLAVDADDPSSVTKKRKVYLSASTAYNEIQKRTKTDSVDKNKPEENNNVDNAREAHEAAIRAAALAERIVTDPGLAKQLLLSMALVRENPRSAPETLPGPGHVLLDGFVWARYPPLENGTSYSWNVASVTQMMVKIYANLNHQIFLLSFCNTVLKKHMAEYYQLSTEKCQSAQQQAFNNDMVVVVREVAEARQWDFADCFDDRALRDRIRCYYKTHIQNAKKRLRTMVRNPTKRANAKHLLQHLDIIEQAKVGGEKVKP